MDKPLRKNGVREIGGSVLGSRGAENVDLRVAAKRVEVAIGGLLTKSVDGTTPDRGTRSERRRIRKNAVQSRLWPKVGGRFRAPDVPKFNNAEEKSAHVVEQPS